MAALHLRHADAYQQLLQAGTPEAESEWQLLISRLTNNESYFFRDKGQMTLLRERILPELIARNKARRSLRLWSAGCASGEEPYSLAILLEQLLPDLAEWQVLSLAADLNRQAMAQAGRCLAHTGSFPK